MAKSINGKVAWITGGGTGIGRSLALELAKRGCHVVLSGRRKAPLEDVAALVESMGQRAWVQVCDVSKPESLDQAVATITSEFGQLDIVIAGAGYSVMGPFEKLALSQWRQQFDVNVFGVVATIQAAMPLLLQSKGRIGVISSVLGKISMRGSAAYSASKYALAGLCNSLHQELYPQGVSVTCVFPGFVKSQTGQVDNDGVFHEEWKDNRPGWLMWEPERAAKVITDALWKRKRDFVFTGHGKAAVFVGQSLPGVFYWAMTRMVKRGRSKPTG